MKKGKQHLNIAIAIDPLSQETLFFNAYIDYMQEKYKAAHEKLEKCLRQNPRNIPAHTVHCYCLLKLGLFDEILSYFDRMPPETVAPGDKLGFTAVAYALKKDVNNAAKYLRELTKHAATPEGFRASAYLLFTYAALGEKEKAFEWIEKAIES